MCVEVSFARNEPSVRGGQSWTKTIGIKVCGSFCHNLRNRFLYSNLGDAGDKHQFKIGIFKSVLFRVIGLGIFSIFGSGGGRGSGVGAVNYNYIWCLLDGRIR